MKLGFSTLGCAEWGLGEIVEAARTNEYEGVELRHYEGSLELAKVIADSPGGPKEFRRRFEEAGVEICCVDTSLVLTDRESRASDGIPLLDLAWDLAAPYLRVFGGDVPEGESREDCLKRAAEKLSHLGKLAAERGLRTLLETHDAFSTGAEVAELLDAVSEEGTGALWDLHHPVRMGEPVAETARLLARRTFHTHVKDSKEGGGYALLGEGDIPLAALVKSLHQAGYTGYLCLEWERAWHPELAGPEVAFPQAAGYLSDLLAELGIPRG
ncbi:MAG: sugar phosphate isomerase/epimerase [Armatimonadota bacterium]|nr:MAG: sugar phosphate isomerase/epimerase [Armatimonadota bacterium]